MERGTNPARNNNNKREQKKNERSKFLYEVKYDLNYQTFQVNSTEVKFYMKFVKSVRNPYRLENVEKFAHI